MIINESEKAWGAGSLSDSAESDIGIITTYSAVPSAASDG